MVGNDSGNGIELKLSSGYTIQISPLPPYYIDVIEDNLPFPEYPTRKIKLAAGDIADWPYEPDPAHEDPSHEDHDLYMRFRAVERQRNEISNLRVKARKDFLLANCVTVLSGPMDFESDEWIDRVEAAFENYIIPEHRGKRMLVFLKTQVITSATELELIINYALSPEVSMQGIINALQGFRDKMEKRIPDRHNRKTHQRKR